MIINKETKARLVDSIRDKEEKILVSVILDKAIKFQKTNVLEFTNFLNLSELSVAEKILDYIQVNYFVFDINKYIEKKNIFFLPDYLDKEKVLSSTISCLKITANTDRLKHKDYMGAIYSLGIRRDVISDIIVVKNSAYFLCMKNMEKYFLTSLFTVGKNEVRVDVVDILSDEVKNLSLSFVTRKYIVPSMRVDVLLSTVYNLSRNETKEKIQKGDLYINDKNIFSSSISLKEGDILSFRKKGKFKVGEKIRETKNKNIVVQIDKYN